ncbi:MAG: VOC family protein [Actinomycetota bacterium]
MLENTPLRPALPASDVERAKKWYSEKLGLEPKSDTQFGSLLYETGGSEFLVYQSEHAGTNQATAAGFMVANFDEVIDDLRSRGVEFDEVDFGEMGKTVDGVITSPDGTMKGAWFRDSEGNILALSTPM